MTSPDMVESSKLMKKYLEDHKIHEVFTGLVESLLQNRPENPLQAIVDYIAEKHGIRASSEVGSSVKAPEMHAAGPADDDLKDEIIESDSEPGFVNDADETADDDSSEDEEESQTVGDLVQITSPAPSRRRISVSAGVMKLDMASSLKYPVFPKSDEAKNQIISRLNENPLFGGCEEGELKTVALAFEHCTYNLNDIIIQQGDIVAEHFFMLDTGTAEAYIGDKCVKKYTSGDTFGELALLYNQPRAATIKATSQVATLWRLNQRTFKTIIVASVMSKRNKYIDFLKRCKLLNELEDIELMTLADSLEKRSYKKGDKIINQGDVGDEFYILEQGECDCVKDGEFLLTLKSGDYFGDIALLYNRPRTASISVSSIEASVLVIDRKTFQRLMGPLGSILRRNPVHAQYR